MYIGSRLRNTLGTNSELPPQQFPEILFITGCMRSGTTFLSNKLSQHPQLLKVGGELNEIWSEIGGAPINPVNEYRNAEDLQMEFANNMTNYFTRSLEEAKRSKRWILRYFYRKRTGGGRLDYDWERIRIMNKSPHLMNKLLYLHAMYPNARFIFIVRSIHGQSASLKMHLKSNKRVRAMPASPKQGWLTSGVENEYDIDGKYPSDFSVIPKMWMRLNEIAFEDISRIPSDRVSVIRYEDFVNRQKELLEKLLQNLDLHPAHQRDVERMIRRGIRIFNTSTSGDPLKKWENHLTDEEKDIIEYVIRESEGKYERIQERLNNLAL